MTRLLALALGIGNLAYSVPAWAQLTTLVDVPSQYYNLVGAAAAPSNGTYAVGWMPDDEPDGLTVIRMAGGNGLWQRSVIAPEGYSMSGDPFISDGDGGLLLGGSVAPIMISNPSDILDTSTYGAVFVHLSPEGQITTVWSLSKTVTSMVTTTVGPERTKAAADPLGGCYMLWDYGGVLERSLELVRCSATGDILWARSIGRPFADDAFDGAYPTHDDYTMSFNSDRTDLLVSPAGDVYLYNMATEPFQCLRIQKITPDGALAWSKTFCLNNAPGQGRCHDAVIGSDGAIHVLVQYGSPEVTHIALKIQLDGTLTSADILPLPTWNFKYLGSDNGHSWLVASDFPRFFHVSPDGNLETIDHPADLESPWQYSTAFFGGGEISNGTLRMLSRMKKEHQVFGTYVQYPVIWQLPMDNLATCGSQLYNAPCVPMPLENFTVAVETDEVSIDVTSFMTATTVEGFTTVDPGFALLDQCEFSVGMVEKPGNATLLSGSDVLANGGTVNLWSAAPGQVQLVAMNGQVVFESAITTGSNTVQLSCGAGIYMLRAVRRDGTVSLSKRVTVL